MDTVYYSPEFPKAGLLVGAPEGCGLSDSTTSICMKIDSYYGSKIVARGLHGVCVVVENGDFQCFQCLLLVVQRFGVGLVIG